MPHSSIDGRGRYAYGVLFDENDLEQLDDVVATWLNDENATSSRACTENLLDVIAPWLRDAYRTVPGDAFEPIEPAESTAPTRILFPRDLSHLEPTGEVSPEIVGEIATALSEYGMPVKLVGKVIDRLTPTLRSIDENADARGAARAIEQAGQVYGATPEDVVVDAEAVAPEQPTDAERVFASVERHLEQRFDELDARAVPGALVRDGISEALRQARAYLLLP